MEQAGEVVRYGADVERAIAMLTINPAKTIGCDQRIGSLEIGKDADIALFNGMPTLDPAAGVVMTLVDGEIAYQSKGF